MYRLASPRNSLIAAALMAACNEQTTTSSARLEALDVRAADATLPAASIEWNEIARGLVIKHQSNPFQAIRVYAITSLAQYNAVIAAERGAREGRFISRRAAVAGASAVTLAYAYPTEAPALDALVRVQITTPGWLEEGHPIATDGEVIGRSIGAAVVGHAKGDSLFAPWSGTVPSGPGLWFSSAVPPAPPVGARFGKARPYFLATGDQLRPPPPPTFGSSEFLSALAEVRRIAETRTRVQDSLAKFWALPVGTFAPAGYWNREASVLAAGERHGERRTAHTLALMGMAGFDALIACHDAKYAYWFLRPSQADPAISPAIGLPNFPAYPSNHACISGAQTEVLGARFPRHRERLSALAFEAAVSRVYGGIHYRFDGDVGLALGRAVARVALRRDVGERDAFPLR
jgi:hypothetical protein